MTPDTLVCDTARIAAWERSGQYAYCEQLVRPNHSLFDELMKLLHEWVTDWRCDIQQLTVTQVMAYFAVIVVLLVLAFWLWQNRYRWTGRMPKAVQNVDYTVTDENIYGVDFERLLGEARRLENHNETVRLVYLRQLRRLADAGLLYWTAGLTPDDYVKSIPPGLDRQVLQQMTAAYVRVRFGHYDADAAKAQEMVDLAAAHRPQNQKGGDA